MRNLKEQNYDFTKSNLVKDLSFIKRKILGKEISIFMSNPNIIAQDDFQMSG